MPRRTKQREAIGEALEQAGRPLSQAEIVRAVEAAGGAASLATVYRTLKLLVETGEAVAVSIPGEPDRYEHRTCAERHHHHFQCDACGKVFDLDGCVDGLSKLLPGGFTLRDHEIFLYGRCEACA